MRISDWSSYVCSSDLGAFGALAFGIGTSEVEHVLATQTLPQTRPGTMAVTVEGELPEGATAKDLILAVIGRIGTGGGIGSIIEYRGSAIRNLSMEGRMTVCNRSEEHTSELQSLMRISYAVFCLKNKQNKHNHVV